MLFPLGALRQASSQWQAVIDGAFGGEWRHILLHAMLFAGLVFLLFALFNLPWNRRGWLAAGLAVLAVGSLQELLQAITGASSATWRGAFFDLGVDLAGGALGMAAWAIARQVTTKRRP